MSEFAKLDDIGEVTQVILADQAFIASGLAGDPAVWQEIVPAGTAGIGWTYDRVQGEFVPPGGFALSVAGAKAQLRAMIEAATAPILDAYPTAEQLSWDAKETEATAFMAAPEPEIAMCPLLVGEISAELGIAAVAVSLEQLAAKAEAVLWMASQFRALVSFLSGLRKRTETAIDAASDASGRRAAVDAARVSIVAVTG